MCEEIGKKQKSKCNIKGMVKNYKNCDDIWIFYAENVYLRTDSENFSSEKLKVVACDSEMKNIYSEKPRKDSLYDDYQN
jgi:hypothetical protein